MQYKVWGEDLINDWIEILISKQSYSIDDLLLIMHILRSDNGCPWDREQTHASIRKNFIEETYEVCEAIDNNDIGLLREELGDVLLQVVFHSQMEEEKGEFNFNDVVTELCRKLIVRHPHVFGDVSVSNSNEVLDNWQKIKQDTKGQTTASETLLSVPRQLPALMRSQKVQGRAKKANSGFGYKSVEDTLRDLENEISELKAEVCKNDIDAISDELGDVLFAAVNVAQRYGLDAEELLTRSCDKFSNRVYTVEKLCQQNGRKLQELDTELLDAFWKKAKEIL